jgi:hypothetical protein
MKKLLMLTVTVVLMFAVTATATETRVMTMGDANNIMKDEANIWLYPSTITMYPGLALGEFCGDDYEGFDFETLGMHYAVGENGIVLGAYLDKVPGEIGYYPGYDGDMMVDHRINLFFGTPMGDNTFGAYVSYYGDSYKADAEGDESAAGAMMFDLGVGLTLMDNFDVAASFGISTWKNEDAEGNAISEPDGNMHFGIGGRYWMDFGGDYVGIPHLMFGYGAEGIKGDDVDDEKTTAMMVDLGWGMNLMPDDRILCVGDFGIMYMNMKYENTDTDDECTYNTIVLPYVGLGIEGHVTSWWDVRMGAKKYWTMYSDEDVDGNKYTWNFAETSTYLGSGIYLGNFTIDVQVDPGFVQWGPNFVSGYTAPLTNRVSVKYNFGG